MNQLQCLLTDRSHLAFACCWLPVHWQTAATAAVVDAIELRGDLLSNDVSLMDTMSAIANSNKPLVLTLRSHQEGGNDRRDDKMRQRDYQTAINSGYCAGCDIEAASPIAADIITTAREAGVVTIASYHNFNALPDEAKMHRIVETMRRLGADIYKLAVRVDTPVALRRLTQFYCRNDAAETMTVLGIGTMGKRSRVILPLLGARISYLAPDNGSAVNGQWSLAEYAQLLAPLHTE